MKYAPLIYSKPGSHEALELAARIPAGPPGGAIEVRAIVEQRS